MDNSFLLTINGNKLSIKRAYFVGLKGIAMAALASFFQDKGVVVGGSDDNCIYPSQYLLDKKNIDVYTNFFSDHIREFKPDIVIYTGAHGGKTNVEVQFSISQNIPTFPHGQVLGSCMEPFKRISVAGTHGKTTTSACIAHLLSSSGLRPNYAIGCGEIFPLGLSGKADTGAWFVAEADEYATDPVTDHTPRFLWQKPSVLVITNIEYDHPDIYQDISAVSSAFASLVNSQDQSGKQILCYDEPRVMKLYNPQSSISYGILEGADFRATNVSYKGGTTEFDVLMKESFFGRFRIHIPGLHNVKNALAVIVVGQFVGLSITQISGALETFYGTKRRFERIGAMDSTLIIDDYAHHPTELRSTLLSIFQWYPEKKIVCIFQPHTYSRTISLMSEFVDSLVTANVTIICDIYSSKRESKPQGATEDMLYKTMCTKYSSCYRASTYEDVENKLDLLPKEQTVLLFAGAGEIGNWASRYVEHLRKNV